MVSVFRREIGMTPVNIAPCWPDVRPQYGRRVCRRTVSLSEDLGKLSEQRPMDIQCGELELGRKYRTVIDPGLQRCRAVDVGVFDEHIADVRAPPPADLPGCYPCHTN